MSKFLGPLTPQAVHLHPVPQLQDSGPEQLHGPFILNGGEMGYLVCLIVNMRRDCESGGTRKIPSPNGFTYLYPTLRGFCVKKSCVLAGWKGNGTSADLTKRAIHWSISQSKLPNAIPLFLVKGGNSSDLANLREVPREILLSYDLLTSSRQPPVQRQTELMSVGRHGCS